MNNIDVLVIGRSCLDYIAIVNQFPDENQKQRLEFRLTEGGGPGGTSSCCISRLGGRVAYVGKLGDDEEGKFCLGRLKACGVTAEFIEIVIGGNTPVSYVFVTAAGGNRTIIYEPSTLPKITIDGVVNKLALQADIALLDPEVTHLCRPLKNETCGKIKLVYDCERWRDGIEDIMDTADYFIPSSEFLEAEALNLRPGPFNQKIFELDNMVRGKLIVTHGKNGAYYVSNDKLYHVSAPEVKAVDTVGAGDNFHGAFALALKKGFDIHQIVKFSVAVASLSCREYGGRKGIPDLSQALATTKTLNNRIIVKNLRKFDRRQRP